MSKKLGSVDNPHQRLPDSLVEFIGMGWVAGREDRSWKLENDPLGFTMRYIGKDGTEGTYNYASRRGVAADIFQDAFESAGPIDHLPQRVEYVELEPGPTPKQYSATWNWIPDNIVQLVVDGGRAGWVKEMAPGVWAFRTNAGGLNWTNVGYDLTGTAYYLLGKLNLRPAPSPEAPAPIGTEPKRADQSTPILLKELLAWLPLVTERLVRHEGGRMSCQTEADDFRRRIANLLSQQPAAEVRATPTPSDAVSRLYQAQPETFSLMDAIKERLTGVPLVCTIDHKHELPEGACYGCIIEEANRPGMSGEALDAIRIWIAAKQHQESDECRKCRAGQALVCMRAVALAEEWEKRWRAIAEKDGSNGDVEVSNVGKVTVPASPAPAPPEVSVDLGALLLRSLPNEIAESISPQQAEASARAVATVAAGQVPRQLAKVTQSLKLMRYERDALQAQCDRLLDEQGTTREAGWKAGVQAARDRAKETHAVHAIRGKFHAGPVDDEDESPLIVAERMQQQIVDSIDALTYPQPAAAKPPMPAMPINLTEKPCAVCGDTCYEAELAQCAWCAKEICEDCEVRRTILENELDDQKVICKPCWATAAGAATEAAPAEEHGPDDVDPDYYRADGVPWNELVEKGEDPGEEFDADKAHYVGSGEDGVYVQALEREDGWYARCVVDSNSSKFTDDLPTLGPFEMRAAAEVAGWDAAKEWCAENDIERTDASLENFNYALSTWLNEHGLTAVEWYDSDVPDAILGKAREEVGGGADLDELGWPDRDEDENYPCSAEDPDDGQYSCTQKLGHPGHHVARDGDDKVLACWPRETPAPDLRRSLSFAMHAVDEAKRQLVLALRELEAPTRVQ